MFQTHEVDVSFVIPCYRSENTVGDVIAEICQVMQGLPYSFEVVAVVDGSPDGVAEVLMRLIERYPDVLRMIELSRNFGQSNALMAGFRAATGTYTVCLDDDGQCPVQHVDELLHPLLSGYDAAVARYPRKIQSRFKNFGSRFNQDMLHKVIGADREFQISNFFAFNRVAKQRIVNYVGPYPYIAGLLVSGSNRIANVDMQQRARVSGSSTYTLKKLVALWLSGFTGFSLAPLHAIAYIGVFFCILAVLSLLLAVAFSLRQAEIEALIASIATISCFMGGCLLVSLALLGEYLGRALLTISGAPQYSIRRRVNVPTGVNLVRVVSAANVGSAHGVAGQSETFEGSDTV